MANSKTLDHRLRVLEARAVRYEEQSQWLTMAQWYRWLRTGELPASELARMQIAVCAERRQEVEDMLARIAELDIPDYESEPGSTFESA